MVSNGSQIADINECTETPGICGSNGVCADTIGAYLCSCEEGYERDQQQCRSKRIRGGQREWRGRRRGARERWGEGKERGRR